jgi:ribosome biogenesis GTPase
MPEAVQGLVIGRAPGYFIVRTDDGLTRLCVLRGKLRRRRMPQRPAGLSRRHGPAIPASDSGRDEAIVVAVGDRVALTPDGTGGAIEAVLPRRNKLSRAAVESTGEQILLANLDLAALVFAVRDPSPHLGLLDRYLVLAEDASIQVLIVFNKIDLGLSDDVRPAIKLYQRLGYDVLLTSTYHYIGIDALRDSLEGRVALLTGPSGVGKSSLLNTLEPGAAQRIGAISEATGKGRHTTTGVRLFPLGERGWLADSAGIRELAPWRLDADRLVMAFVEFRPLVDRCEFDDCDHLPGAQGCAILAAVASGAVAASRYESFARMHSELLRA